MRADEIKPYALYVIAFSFVRSLASVLHVAVSSWSWGFSTWSISSIFGIFFNLPGHIFYAVLQVVAAVLTVKAISLRKLFYLSCVFTVIEILLTGLNRRMMEASGTLFFPLFMMGGLLPYVAPVIILALIGRRKSVVEPSPGVGERTTPTCAGSKATAESEARDEIRALCRRYWYAVDMLLIIIVYLHGTLNDPFGFFWYTCGLCNRLELRAYILFMWVALMLPATLCGVVLLLRMIISWPKYIQNKRRLLLFRLLVIVGLGSYLVLPFTPLKSPGMHIYIKGFRHYIEAKADIAGIRSWLASLGPEDCVVYNITLSGGRKASSPKDLQKQEWPKVVGKLKPRYVTLSLDDDRHPMVRLNWGSGFLGSWGLTVGDEAMPTPKSDLSPHGEYRQEIRQGAYIWYGMD